MRFENISTTPEQLRSNKVDLARDLMRFELATRMAMEHGYVQCAKGNGYISPVQVMTRLADTNWRVSPYIGSLWGSSILDIDTSLPDAQRLYVFPEGKDSWSGVYSRSSTGDVSLRMCSREDVSREFKAVKRGNTYVVGVGSFDMKGDKVVRTKSLEWILPEVDAEAGFNMAMENPAFPVGQAMELITESIVEAVRTGNLVEHRTKNPDRLVAMWDGLKNKDWVSFADSDQSSPGVRRYRLLENGMSVMDDWRGYADVIMDRDGGVKHLTLGLAKGTGKSDTLFIEGDTAQLTSLLFYPGYRVMGKEVGNNGETIRSSAMWRTVVF